MADTIVINTSSPEAIPAALKVLQAGGLITFPTDTVYGLASRLDSHDAIERIFVAKGRDFNKAIAVLIGDLEQLPIVARDLPDPALRLAARFWPGALTLVVLRQPNLPENLSPTPTVGVRMPDHTFARQLLRAVGPLATTSANLSGQPNPFSAEDVLAQLNGRIDLVLDGGRVAGGIPSTVLDCTSLDLKILRQGAISEQEINKTFNQP